MKKFVVMTLAAAAVVGCSKENVKPGGEGAESQKLNVLTSIQTKSAIDGVVMPVGSAIGVQLTDATDNTKPFNGISSAQTGDGFYTDANNIRFINEAGANIWVSKAADGKDKLLMMTGANAGQVFAYYPYTATVTNLGESATVPVTIENTGEIDITGVT